MLPNKDKLVELIDISFFYTCFYFRCITYDKWQISMDLERSAFARRFTLIDTV